MFTLFIIMIIYSSDKGTTLIDNYDESYLDIERELESEVFNSQEKAWSGALYDWFSNESNYSRPNILF